MRLGLHEVGGALFQTGVLTRRGNVGTHNRPRTHVLRGKSVLGRGEKAAVCKPGGASPAAQS